jgi:hypothetical protein
MRSASDPAEGRGSSGPGAVPVLAKGGRIGESARLEAGWSDAREREGQAAARIAPACAARIATSPLPEATSSTPWADRARFDELAPELACGTGSDRPHDGWGLTQGEVA